MSFFVPFVVGATSGIVGTVFVKHSSGANSSATAKETEFVMENEKLRARIKEMQGQIDSLLNSNRKQRKEYESVDEEIEELEDKLANAEKEIKSLKEQLSRSEAIIFDYKATVARLESEIKN